MRTTELIAQLNGLHKISAKLAYGEILVQNDFIEKPFAKRTFYTLPVHAYCMTTGVLDTTYMQGIPLATLGDIEELFSKYTETPVISRKEAEDTYIIQLPSGHYMRSLYHLCNFANVEWIREANLASRYTKHEIMDNEPSYWQFAYKRGTNK